MHLRPIDDSDALAARVDKLEATVERISASVDAGWRPEALPAPDGHREAGMSGPLWHPASRWTVQAHCDDEFSQVYVNTPHSWGSDVVPLSPVQARQLAQTLWAAANMADAMDTSEADAE